MPLSEACQIHDLLSFDAQDWDQVGHAMEHAGLIKRPRFTWPDKEPDTGLKEVAPSKHALHCLVGYGIVTLRQLQHSRLSALLSLRQHLLNDDLSCLIRRLCEASTRIKGAPGLLNDSDQRPVSWPNLHDPTAQMPIEVLKLSSQTQQYLQRHNVHSLRELVHQIPDDAAGYRNQGSRRLWEEARAALQAYLDSKSLHSPLIEGSASQNPETTQAPTLVPRQSETTDHSDRLSEMVEDRSVSELGLPDYSLNCLLRAGIKTVDQLRAVLNQGFSQAAIPGIRRKHAWDQIRAAVDRYMASDSVTAPVSTRAGDNLDAAGLGISPDTTPSADSYSAELNAKAVLDRHSALTSRPISVLGLPGDVANQLAWLGICTVGELITLSLKGSHQPESQVWKLARPALEEYLAAQPDANQTSASAGIAPYVQTPPEPKPPVIESSNDPITFKDLPSATIEHRDDYQAKTEPPPAAPTSHSHANVGIDPLDLPSDIANALRNHDANAMLALATLPLVQLAQISEIATLTHEDWFRVMPALKHLGLLVRLRRASTRGKPARSLLALDISPRTLNSLVGAGILDLETLARRTLTELASVKHLGAASIEEVVRGLRTAIDAGTITCDTIEANAPPAEAPADPINTEPNHPSTSPNELPEAETDEAQRPAVIALDAQLDAWFADLNANQRQVLEWRYGLTDGQDLTLEQIGRQLNLTRERVRQIEQKALQFLQRQAGLASICALMAELRADVVAEGGVMSEARLGNALADITEVGHTNPHGAVRLLLQTSDKLIRVNGTDAWCLPQLREMVPLIGLQVIDILTRALAPLSIDELVQRCMQIQGRHDQPGYLYDKFILGCVRVNDKLVERHDGNIGLATWKRHWRDDIIFALRRMGEPAHYTAITKTINASLEDGQHVTARAVHAHLMQHRDIFVCVGDRGTYGLREWQVRSGPSYVDVLAQVLEDAGLSLDYRQDSGCSD